MTAVLLVLLIAVVVAWFVTAMTAAAKNADLYREIAALRAELALRRRIAHFDAARRKAHLS